jgi:hypothetical protein
LKNIAFQNTSDLMANSISAFSGSSLSVIESGEENGTWLWTPVREITPEYEAKIIEGAKKNGIKNIYLSVDSYLDIYSMQNGAEKEKEQKLFDDILKNFISLANKNGIEVDAEAGWRNWAEDGNTYKALVTIHHIIEFNKNKRKNSVVFNMTLNHTSFRLMKVIRKWFLKVI